MWDPLGLLRFEHMRLKIRPRFALPPRTRTSFRPTPLAPSPGARVPWGLQAGLGARRTPEAGCSGAAEEPALCEKAAPHIHFRREDPRLGSRRIPAHPGCTRRQTPPCGPWLEPRTLPRTRARRKRPAALASLSPPPPSSPPTSKKYSEVD